MRGTRPLFAGRVGVADAVTVGNAALGFCATLSATVDPDLAARLVLLAAVADGLDGVLARRYGGTAAGPYLDSLADVASFGVAPAMLVGGVATRAWTLDGAPVALGAGVALPALFVAMAVTRLGMYTAYDADSDETRGVPTTLAATVLAAGVLAGYDGAVLLVGAVGALAVSMVTTVAYPDLHAEDALVMGAVQVAAVFLTGDLGRGFAFGLLVLALAYLLLGPLFYWGR